MVVRLDDLTALKKVVSLAVSWAVARVGYWGWCWVVWLVDYLVEMMVAPLVRALDMYRGCR